MDLPLGPEEAGSPRETQNAGNSGLVWENREGFLEEVTELGSKEGRGKDNVLGEGVKGLGWEGTGFAQRMETHLLWLKPRREGRARTQPRWAWNPLYPGSSENTWEFEEGAKIGCAKKKTMQ